MKTLILLLIITSIFASCKKSSKGSSEDTTPYVHGSPIVEDLTEACESHNAYSLEQTRCEEIGGTHSEVVIPQYSFCEITTNEDTCEGNSGTWSSTKVCNNVQEDKCAINSGTWAVTKNCIIHGLNFTRVDGTEEEAEQVCTLHGSLSYTGSCTITNESSCTIAEGSWQDSAQGSCTISTQNSCENANGTWKTIASSTVNVCSGYNVDNINNCSTANGSWTKNSKFKVSINLDGTQDLSGKLRVRYSANTGLNGLPTENYVVSAPSMTIYLSNYTNDMFSPRTWKNTRNLELIRSIFLFSEGINAYEVNIPFNVNSQQFIAPDFMIFFNVDAKSTN